MIDYGNPQTVLDACKKYQKDIDRGIEKLEIFLAENQEDKASETLDEISNVAEKSLWFIKGLSVALSQKEGITEADIISKMKLPEAVSVKRDEFGIVFTLPQLTGKSTTKRRYMDGKIISSYVTALLDRNADIVKKVETPVLVFEHHINPKEGLSRSVDPDNMDVKAVIDALQGTVIEDDNALAISLMHIGVKDETSFCKLHIFPRRRLSEWLFKHPKLR